MRGRGLSMSDVVEVMLAAGLTNAVPGPLGVTWGPLRVESGSGIAGQGGRWHIAFPGCPDMKAIGQVTTRAGLRKALRDVLLWCCRSCIGVSQLLRGPREDL
jgi:hypothetical protein